MLCEIELKGVRQLSANFYEEKPIKPEQREQRAPRGDGEKVCYAYYICGSRCNGDKSKCPYETETRIKNVKIIYSCG